MDRKILACVLVIGVVSMLVGAGTLAYFSDTETSEGNTLTVGLGPDLELGPCGDQPTLPFDIGDIKPGESGVADINLHNAGPADGWLSMKLINCVNDENGLIEPEIDAGDEGQPGELGSKLYLIIWFDDDNDGEIDGDWLHDGGEQPIAEGYVDDLCGGEIPIDGSPFQSDGKKTYDTMEAGMTWTIGFKWSLASDVGNIVQSDSVSFDIEFTLTEEEPSFD